MPPRLLGLSYAAAAYLLWGGISIYFKALQNVPPLEVLGHRVLWSALVMVLGVLLFAPRRELGRLFEDRRKLAGLALSALLLSSNWLMFIWAVGSGQALEGGLGYFICPLVSVALGAAFFKERMNRAQLVGLAVVILGVASTVTAFGRPPWIALFLAATFGLYGLMRKKLGVPALLGLFAETVLMLPLALLYLAWLHLDGEGHFLALSWPMQLLLAASGLVTTIPLLFFNGAATRLDLTSLGLMQYLNPTMQIVIAVQVFGESFTQLHAATFALIWLGLVIFSLAPLLARRGQPLPAGPLEN